MGDSFEVSGTREEKDEYFGELKDSVIKGSFAYHLTTFFRNVLSIEKASQKSAIFASFCVT